MRGMIAIVCAAVMMPIVALAHDSKNDHGTIFKNIREAHRNCPDGLIDGHNYDPQTNNPTTWICRPAPAAAATVEIILEDAKQGLRDEVRKKAGVDWDAIQKQMEENSRRLKEAATAIRKNEMLSKPVVVKPLELDEMTIEILRRFEESQKKLEDIPQPVTTDNGEKYGLNPCKPRSLVSVEILQTMLFRCPSLQGSSVVPSRGWKTRQRRVATRTAIGADAWLSPMNAHMESG